VARSVHPNNRTRPGADGRRAPLEPGGAARMA